MREEISIKDLSFPLISELELSKSSLAKQKLLTGEAKLKLDNNEFNSIILHNNGFYLNIPKFDADYYGITFVKHIVCKPKEHTVLSKVSGSLYKIRGTTYYFIIRNNIILCIMRLKISDKSDEPVFRELDDYYEVIFSNIRRKIYIEKEDLSFGIRSV